MFPTFGLCVMSYVLASFPIAYVIARLLRVDLSKVGSRNIGASNLAFHCGACWALPIILFDIIVKGYFPIFLGLKYLDPESFFLLTSMPAFASIAGHNWSCFLRFKGGRGVSVIIGILIATMPLMFLFSSLLFVTGWLFSKNTGLWVLLTLCSIVIWSFVISQSPLSLTIASGCLLLMVVKRLTSNLESLHGNIPKKHVFLNRLLHDRDIADRQTWISRGPA